MANIYDYLDQETYLEHHGIKGQKWGVRRFQNADGSLTNAGKSRYNTDTTFSTQKSLNKIEKQNAKLRARSAMADVKAGKAFNRNDKKYQKYKNISSEAKKSISAGESLSKKLISEASKKGYTVSSVNKTRYTHTGKLVAGQLLFGPVGTMTLAGIDAYRAYNYGPEAGGVVKGKKYTVR